MNIELLAAFRYRRARILNDDQLAVRDGSAPDLIELRQKLSELSKTPIDNHTAFVYVEHTGDGKPNKAHGIFFSDRRVIFGLVTVPVKACDCHPPLDLAWNDPRITTAILAGSVNW